MRPGYLLLIVIAAWGGAWWIGMNRRKYMGQRAVGWGGNLTGNLPATLPHWLIVQKPLPQGATMIFAPPGVPYGPSNTTNAGSAGGY